MISAVPTMLVMEDLVAALLSLVPDNEHGLHP
jgi:hypothetical protein